MEFSKTIKNRSTTKNVLMAAAGGAMLLGGSAAFASGKGSGYTLSGACGSLPAARATEFHGNPDKATLRLGMAGNQWVVFEEAMRQFAVAEGVAVIDGAGDSVEPGFRENGDWTLADLNQDANKVYIQLIPPGQIANQITSGCMTLGNDEDRNLLPGNLQVNFDVFASTNYTLMQKLAKKGFVEEAVPYIANRLDLMVKAGNAIGIGTDTPTGDAAFDRQFDTAMDLLSGDVVASALDHINEGIHKASNGYMKKVDKFIRTHANKDAPITMDYHFGDHTHSGMVEMTATQWLDAALAAVATPHPDSPGAKRLISGDSGENHSSHNLANIVVGGKKDCLQADGVSLKFCEFAVINKFNTHESRVHHVETPNGVVITEPTDGFIPVDVGFVWITELAYQINAGNTAVTGMNGAELGDTAPALGIVNDGGVNGDKIYSLALLATSENKERGERFIDFLRSPEGQAVYVAGGFTGLTDAQLDAGECYHLDDGVYTQSSRVSGECDD